MIWTEEHDREISQLLGNGKSWDEIGMKFGVSGESARSRWKRIGQNGVDHRIAILHISDVHYGKRTESYNSEVVGDKVKKFSEKVSKIAKYLPYKIDKVMVVCTGDFCDGQMIYPTQHHHQDETDFLKQVNRVCESFYSWLVDLTKTFHCEVEFHGAPGNHGRISNFHHESSNVDILAYHTLEIMAKDRTDISVEYPRDGFIHKFKIYDIDALAYHGHAIRMYQSIPRYGIAQRMQRWAIAKSLGDWKYLFIGHFHICESFSINDKSCFIAGTPVSDDTWALEKLGYESQNYWWMLLARRDNRIEECFRLKV